MWLVGAVDNKKIVIVELGPSGLIPAAWSNDDWTINFFIAKLVVIDIFFEEIWDAILVIAAGGDEEILIHDHHIGAAVVDIGFDEAQRWSNSW